MDFSKGCQVSNGAGGVDFSLVYGTMWRDLWKGVFAMKKLWILLFVGVIAACGGADEPTAGGNNNPIMSWSGDGEETGDDFDAANLEQIEYSDVFDQNSEEYFVFFWQEGCPFVAEFGERLAAALESGASVFGVDMRYGDNSNAWYDWETHHEENSMIIGEVIDGEYVLFDDAFAENFPEEDGWAIVEYEPGVVWARLNRAFVNRLPMDADDLGVSTTPTLIRIVDGSVAGYAVGVEEGEALLDQFCP